jgi:DNA repair protein RecO (recombination protein O)
MENLKLEGIIIKSIDYDESSKIIHLLTKDGIKSILCKGARRIKSRFLASIEIMNKVEVVTTNKKFPILLDVTLLNSYNKIKYDLKTFLWYSYIFELLSKLPLDIDYNRFYKFFLEILNKSDNPMLISEIFQIKVLSLFGVTPEFNKCVVCGKPYIGFSIKLGGFVCHDHLDNNYPIEPFLNFKKLYYFDIYNDDLNKLNDIDLIELFKYITMYYEYHVEIKLNTLTSLII